MSKIPVHVVGDDRKPKVASAHRLLEEGNFEEAVKVLGGIERDDQVLARLGLVPKSVKVR